MNIAIRTRFHAQTAHRSARVTATAPCGLKLTKALQSLCSSAGESRESCHRKVAEALRDKLELSGSLVGGQLGDGSFVFCFGPTEDRLKEALRWALPLVNHTPNEVHASHNPNCPDCAQLRKAHALLA